MKFNRTIQVDIDVSLDNFLKNERNKSSFIRHLQKEYKHRFERLSRVSASLVQDYEYISPLECAAILGSDADIKTLLIPSNRYVISYLRTQDKELTYKKQAAFFRALESGNIAVANLLINDPQVKSATEEITITKYNTELQNKYEFLRNMLLRQTYTLFMNHIFEEGNLALFLAAKLGDANLFFDLLRNIKILKQLHITAIPAFVYMTRTDNAETVKINDLDIDILETLLNTKCVSEYVNSRLFDYEELLQDFKRIKSRLPINESTNSLAEMTANATTLSSMGSSSTLFASPTNTTNTPCPASEEYMSSSPAPLTI